MSGYGKCPRCGVWAMEHLRTHSHCWECNFFPEEKRSYRLLDLIGRGFSMLGSARKPLEEWQYDELEGMRERELPYEREHLLTMPFMGIL